MKRRSEENDYLDRGIYMITLAIQGRQPLLGQLAGNPEATQGENVPHVALSALGEAVKSVWLDIPKHHPEVEPLKLCIMPDHIHGILFVRERMERHLGHVINGFKTGTRQAARQLAAGTEALPLPTRRKAAPYAEAAPQPEKRKHPPVGTLWEPGYNDRILLRQGQLQRWQAYLDDNPRRLLLKRQHPEYFTQLANITAAGLSMPAMGNRFLLDRPVKLQVQCSRHLYPWEIEQQKQAFLEQGRQGAVIVSPCISPGEQQIATACMEARIPLVVLLLKGFPPFFKPQPRYLEACAGGRLLMLAPYPWQNEKLTDMRRRCLSLNALAAAICQGE